MTTILYILIGFLVIVFLVQFTRINELLAQVNNKNANDITDEDNDKVGVTYLLYIYFLFFL